MTHHPIGPRDPQATGPDAPRVGATALGPTLVALALLTLTAAACTLPATSSGTAPASLAPAAPALTEEEIEVHLEAYDRVWTTVRDKHFDPTLHGVDWDAVRAEQRPRVESARSIADVRRAMRETLAALGDSHFGIIPREVYADQDAARADDDADADEREPVHEGEDEGEGKGENEHDGKAEHEGEAEDGHEGEHGDGGEGEGEVTELPGPGESGVSVRVIEGKAIVTSVWREWPAWEAGVRPGLEVAKIGNWDVREAIEAADDRAESFVFFSMVEGRLNTLEGKTIPVTFLDANDDELRIEVPSGPERGDGMAFGNMPGVPVWVESDPVADGTIGYVRFNIFLNPGKLISSVQRAITENLEADGFIIDLRGNPGGIGGLAMGIAGWFVDERDLFLGTMKTRTTDLKFIVNPRPPHFDGPVAVLIDGGSASTSEILAGGLQDLGRARVFGTTSAGAALPSMIEELPNGDRFQYATANYVSRGGDVLEGNGVEPDETVIPTRDELLEGRDPVLEAAIAWIRAGAPMEISQ